MWAPFETRASGKWVLTGEHAVIRGYSAVALPLADRALSLRFEPSHTGRLEIFSEQVEGAPAVHDLLNALEDQWQSEDRSFPRPSGTLRISSTIPVGAGLGSSAALCVALTRWLREPLAIQEDQILEFARQLENRFHGRSSGMDVAVILAGEPVSFSISRGPRTLGIHRLPHFSFHDTGLRSRTSDCVFQVQEIHRNTPALALSIDEAMAVASREATEGLMLFDAGQTERGLALLAQAMRRADECFLNWKLVPPSVREQQERLLSEGALAVKLTGAGNGGMLVALHAR